MGEMGLSEQEFWSLTMPVFNIKHAAFARAEDRARSLVLELAVMTGSYKDNDRKALRRTVNALRRYPVRELPDGD